MSQLQTIKKKQITRCFYCNSDQALEMEERFGYFVYHCYNCGKVDGRALVTDDSIFEANYGDKKGHMTVGALLFHEASQKFLLMKKKTHPFFVDVIAGHLDINELPVTAVRREVHEETGLDIIKEEMIWEGLIKNDYCRRGVGIHYWNIFLVDYSGAIKIDEQEVQYLRYYNKDELLQEMELNPVIRDVIRNYLLAKNR